MVKGFEKLLKIMNDKGLDGIIIKGKENILYLTGFKGSEGTLLVAGGKYYLFTDSRYVTYAVETLREVEVIEIGSENHEMARILLELGIKRLGFDSFNISYGIFEEWKQTFREIELVPVGKEIEEIRKIKEEWEIERIGKAIEIAEMVFFEIIEEIKEGVSERDIAIEIGYRIEKAGAHGLSFPTIVAFGERSALPHAIPSERKAKYGDVILLDFGAIYDDYCGDETFTLFLGRKDKTIEKVSSIVSEAKKLAMDALKVGTKISHIDMIARDFIKKKGFGDYFKHGLGHGIGISVHEPPSLTYKNNDTLASNMVFTLEPGIYIPHRFGIRFEDVLVLKEEGVKMLTQEKKGLIYI